MKVCCCSRSYARVLQSGALTQLEWIDRCAELALDGVDYGAAHFPRTDADYLAQLKKVCTDRGLTAACLALDDPFGGGDVDAQSSEVEAWIDRAVALGVPVVRFGCASATGAPGVAWRELVRGLKRISAAAKARNVTLALEARASSLVATASEAKRALKECDSAWLRLASALAPLRADEAGEWSALSGETVVALATGADGESDALAGLSARGYVGFVSLESSGDDEDTAAGTAAARLRRALQR